MKNANLWLSLLLAATIPACNPERSSEPQTPETGLRLEAVSRTRFDAVVGEHVNPAPTVTVTSATGQPVSGITVMFSLFDPSQGDVLTNSVAVTNAAGIAKLGDWKLGTIPGVHSVQASIKNAQSSDLDRSMGPSVTFTADVAAGPPVSLSITYANDSVGLPGDALQAPLVLVRDRFGNGASGIPVSFTIGSGGGSLVNAINETRGGIASPGTWTLGPRPGLNSIVASAAGLSPVTIWSRALDAGAVTWYDLTPQPTRLVSGALALCEDGTFQLTTVESSDAFPGVSMLREFGKYTIMGTKIVLTFSGGSTTEQGTLAGNRLSLLHTSLNWFNYPAEEWTFIRRE